MLSLIPPINNSNNVTIISDYLKMILVPFGNE